MRGGLLYVGDVLLFDYLHASLPRETDQSAYRGVRAQDCATRIIDAVTERATVELGKSLGYLVAVEQLGVEPLSTKSLVIFHLKRRAALVYQ